MLARLHLTLLIGTTLPQPVSQDVIDALTSVRVTNTVDGPSLFQLQFALNNRSRLHTIFLLSGQAQVPLLRMVILVTCNGNTRRLIDGVITRQEVAPGSRRASRR